MGQKCTTTGKAAPKLTRPQDDVIRDALFASAWETAHSLLVALGVRGGPYGDEDRCAELAALMHDIGTLLECPEYMADVIEKTPELSDNSRLKPYVAQALAMVEAVRQRVSA